jgi:hypothetical protein
MKIVNFEFEKTIFLCEFILAIIFASWATTIWS